MRSYAVPGDRYADLADDVLLREFEGACARLRCYESGMHDIADTDASGNSISTCERLRADIERHREAVKAVLREAIRRGCIAADDAAPLGLGDLDL